LDKKKPKDYVEIGVDAEDYYRIKDSENFLISYMPNPDNLSEEKRGVQYDGYLSQLKHWR